MCEERAFKRFKPREHIQKRVKKNPKVLYRILGEAKVVTLFPFPQGFFDEDYRITHLGGGTTHRRTWRPGHKRHSMQQMEARNRHGNNLEIGPFWSVSLW